MISDVQLGVFANFMGVMIMVLLVIYHYVTASREVGTIQTQMLLK